MQKWEYQWIHFFKADSNNIYTEGDGRRYTGPLQCLQLLDRFGDIGYEMYGITSSFDQTGGYMQMQIFLRRPMP